MYNSYFRVCLIVIVLMLPLVVSAAGLGQLKLNSSLGQPLSAEIDISASEDEVSSLKAELASRESFAQAGISYQQFFPSLNISIEPRVNGDPYVTITSPQAINEPFLNILLELSWNSGRLLREYTVLLDPVEYEKPEPIAPVFRTEQVAVVEEPEPEPEPVSPVTVEVEKQKQVKVVQAGVNGNSYGPVERGDTLFSIARKITKEPLNLNQVLMALYRTNRDAFIDDNMNLLRAGAILHIPDNSEVLAIDGMEANAEVKIQVANWRKYSDKLVEGLNESPPSDTPKQFDSGQITTRIENDSASLNEGAEEVLRLSSGAHLIDELGDGSDASMIDRIRMMEEDAIARNLALEEANERVAMLEKQINDLQRLLELQQPSLAQAQLHAEAILDDEVKPEAELDTLEEVISVPDSGLEIDAAIVGQEMIESIDAPIDEAVQEPTVIPEPIPQEPIDESIASPLLLATEEKSYMDSVMGNIEYVAGLLVALLLGLLVVIKRRKKKEEDNFDDDMDFADDVSPSMRNKMASSVAAGTTSAVVADNLSNEKTIAGTQEENGHDEDFDNESNFFSAQAFDEPKVIDENVTPEPIQETVDNSFDKFTPDYELELSSDEASRAQTMSDDLFVLNEIDAPVEADQGIAPGFVADDTVKEKDGVSQFEPNRDEVMERSSQLPSAAENEIEFDLNDISDQKTEVAQEKNQEDELATDLQIELPGEMESSKEFETVESAVTDEVESNDKVDLDDAQPLEPRGDLEAEAEALSYEFEKGAAVKSDANDNEIEVGQEESQQDGLATDLQIELSSEMESSEELGAVESAVADEVESNDNVDSDDTQLSEAPGDLEAAAEALSYEFEKGAVVETDTKESPMETPDTQPEEGDTGNDKSIDFELDTSLLDLPSDESVDIGNDSVSDGNAALGGDASNNSQEESSIEAEIASPKIDFSDIDLNIEDDASSEKINSEQWQEVETKIDLAKAYQDMEDEEGAREMLEEIIRDGDVQQKEAAKALLEKL